MCVDEARLQGWSQSDVQRFSDSDIGIQMIKGPLRLLRSQLPFPGEPYYTVLRTDIIHRDGNAARCFEPTICTYNCLTDWGFCRPCEGKGDRYSGGRVLTSIQSLTMSPFLRAVMKPVC